MDNAVVHVAGVIAAVGSGLVAGVFLTFSVLVVPALRRQSPKRGISVMQAINTAALTPTFLLPFVVTGLACLVVGVAAVSDQADSGAGLTLVGVLCYLVGCLLVTGVYLVPRNKKLAERKASDAEAQSYWVRYLQEWTAMNHVRAVAALAAAVTLTLGAA